MEVKVTISRSRKPTQKRKKILRRYTINQSKDGLSAKCMMLDDFPEFTGAAPVNQIEVFTAEELLRYGQLLNQNPYPHYSFNSGISFIHNGEHAWGVDSDWTLWNIQHGIPCKLWKNSK